MTDRPITKTDNQPPPLITADQLRADFGHLETELTQLESIELPTVLEDEEDLAAVTKVATDIIALRKRIEAQRVAQSRPILDAQEVVNRFFKGDLTYRATVRQTFIEIITGNFLKKKADRERAAREAAAEAARKEMEASRQRAAEAVAKTAESGSVMPALKAAEQANNALTDFANKQAAATAPISNMSRSVTTGGSAGLQANWVFEIESIDSLDVIALRPFFTVAAIEAAMRAFVKSGRREIVGARIFEDAKTRFRA